MRMSVEPVEPLDQCDREQSGRQRPSMKRTRTRPLQNTSGSSRIPLLGLPVEAVWYCYLVIVAQLASRFCVSAWMVRSSYGRTGICHLQTASFWDSTCHRSAAPDFKTRLFLSLQNKPMCQLQIHQSKSTANTLTMFVGFPCTAKAPKNSKLLTQPLASEQKPQRISIRTNNAPTPIMSKRLERYSLGFDVFRLDATPSNVDMKTWKTSQGRSSKIDPLTSNNGDPFSPQTASTLGMPWNVAASSQQNQHREWLFDVAQCVLPDHMPWIPTRSHIDSLKVVNLKRACAERGLSKTGTKATLRERLWNWTLEQQNHDEVKLTGDFLARYFEDSVSISSTNEWANNFDPTNHVTSLETKKDSTPNSLADWARNIDLEPLFQKRKEIHRQKREGRPAPHKSNSQEANEAQTLTTPEYLKSLAKALRAPSSPFSSNIQVRELYTAAKQADQLGERMVAIDLLQTLVMVTPNDARVVRRLARMLAEQGEIEQAKLTLKTGLETQTGNPWLWHGLGQLERKHGSYLLAKECFEKAIECDATFAQSYHALGSMEYSKGNVANAMRIVKKGIEYCPTNHRLWHACGGFYRAAQMLEDADRSYRKALKHGPTTSHCFVYSALAAVAYEQGDIDLARSWLVKSVEVNSGRHAQGWVALAQLEESENNIKKAQLICTSAIAQYERGLLETRHRYLKKSGNGSSLEPTNSTSSVELSNQLLRNVPKYRSGDKFVHVYRNWARLEERYGSAEAVDRVYERACIAFPDDYKLLLTWAQYHRNLSNYDKARVLFQRACKMVGHRHGDPYRMSAEMEMSLSNFQEARRILYLGAQAVFSRANATTAADDGKGVPQLLHAWAICEWHIGNLDLAEVLLSHALRLAGTTDAVSPIRSFILYSMARFKYYRGELHLAQHCIGLIMKDNIVPGGSGKVWALWAEIARDMKNTKLEEQCLAHLAQGNVDNHGKNDLAHLLNVCSNSEVLAAVQPSVESMLRRDPWQVKLFTSVSDPFANMFKQLKFPSKKGLTSRVK